MGLDRSKARTLTAYLLGFISRMVLGFPAPFDGAHQQNEGKYHYPPWG